uniref:Uncharacterized protein n=1 Tax=Phenylobacterium glaciei TaxID=2803784 RepID=A0A974P6T4_9CAUL|nr:hypothetical protein JKL49_10810 [Phenylobacterium glaciei]
MAEWGHASSSSADRGAQPARRLRHRRPPIVAPAGSSLGELEPLYSANAGREALTIRVASNGCTKKEDFAFFVEKKGMR